MILPSHYSCSVTLSSEYATVQASPSAKWESEMSLSEVLIWKSIVGMQDPKLKNRVSPELSTTDLLGNCPGTFRLWAGRLTMYVLCSFYFKRYYRIITKPGSLSSPLPSYSAYFPSLLSLLIFLQYSTFASVANQEKQSSPRMIVWPLW